MICRPLGNCCSARGETRLLIAVAPCGCYPKAFGVGKDVLQKLALLLCTQNALVSVDTLSMLTMTRTATTSDVTVPCKALHIHLDLHCFTITAARCAAEQRTQSNGHIHDQQQRICLVLPLAHMRTWMHTTSEHCAQHRSPCRV